MNNYFKISLTVILFFFCITVLAQEINDKGVGSQFVHGFDDLNNNTFKPGYTAGARYDSAIKGNHFYSISLSANHIVCGSKLINKYTIEPIMGEFTHYKAENKLTTINVAAHLLVAYVS